MQAALDSLTTVKLDFPNNEMYKNKKKFLFERKSIN